MKTPLPHPEVDFARDIVLEAGEIALRYFRKPMDVVNKLEAYYDPVTEADRNIETLLRRRIGERYPEHKIVGEEHGTTGTGDTWWIIDPIDGTRAFISGMPNWGILLGWVEDGRPTVGAMHQPFTGETYLGGPAGSWIERGGHRLAIRAGGAARLEDAILYSTHPSMFTHPQLERYGKLSEQVRMQRWGGDCYAFCMLALGCVDVVVEGMLMPYDIVPLIPIIEGAGGVVTDAQGRRPMGGGLVIAAANAELHAAALEHMGQD
jgi:histidinol phosphatase-like enzyme (inositol monophosphatase family)